MRVPFLSFYRPHHHDQQQSLCHTQFTHTAHSLSLLAFTGRIRDLFWTRPKTRKVCFCLLLFVVAAGAAAVPSLALLLQTGGVAGTRVSLRRIFAKQLHGGAGRAVCPCARAVRKHVLLLFADPLLPLIIISRPLHAHKTKGLR
jgi:hypothetical protein